MILPSDIVIMGFRFLHKVVRIMACFIHDCCYCGNRLRSITVWQKLNTYRGVWDPHPSTTVRDPHPLMIAQDPRPSVMVQGPHPSMTIQDVDQYPMAQQRAESVEERGLRKVISRAPYRDIRSVHWGSERSSAATFWFCAFASFFFWQDFLWLAMPSDLKDFPQWGHSTLGAILGRSGLAPSLKKSIDFGSNWNPQASKIILVTW